MNNENSKEMQIYVSRNLYMLNYFLGNIIKLYFAILTSSSFFTINIFSVGCLIKYFLENPNFVLFIWHLGQEKYGKQSTLNFGILLSTYYLENWGR